MPVDAALLWLCSFAHIFLLGFQSRNVNAGRYAWAMATSFALAGAQLVFVKAVVGGMSWQLLLALTGTAGPLGIASAMWVTRHLGR